MLSTFYLLKVFVLAGGSLSLTLIPNPQKLEESPGELARSKYLLSSRTYIPDSETAELVARIYLRGENKGAKWTYAYKAEQQSGIWFVQRSPSQRGVRGGGARIGLRAKDGAVVFLNLYR